jgi:hypothetical protein
MESPWQCCYRGAAGTKAAARIWETERSKDQGKSVASAPLPPTDQQVSFPEPKEMGFSSR